MPPSSSEAAAGAAHNPKVFISYSRRDLAFVNRLAEALEAHSITPRIDRTEIYSFEDWWKRIQVLIAEADTVVFVLSPDSVASDVCRREVDYALSLRKRFAPIVCRSVADQMAHVPKELADLNFIFFDAPDGFDPAMARLAEALGTDIAWVRKHTQFGLDAQAWIDDGRPSGLLLRPPRLEEAERWIASRPPGAPLPTPETQTFILDSRRGASRRRNMLTGSLAAGLVLAVGLAAAAVVFGLEAKSQKRVADQKTVEANTQRDAARTAQTQAEQRSSLLAAAAAAKFSDQGDFVSADLLLLNAAKAFAPNTTPDTLLIADSNLIDRQERAAETDIPPGSRIIDADGAVFIASDAEKSVWTYDDRGLVKLLDGANRAAGVWLAAVDADGSYLFLSLDGKVERLCKTCAQPQTTATLPSLAKYTLRTDPDWHQTASFFESGWLVRESPTTGPGESTTVIDILDLRSGQVFQITDGPQEVVPAKAPTGETLFFDGDHLSTLKTTDAVSKLEPLAKDLDESLRTTIPYTACAAHFREGMRAAALEQLQFTTIFDCRTFGPYGLLTIVRHAASADSRSDWLFFPEGDGRDPKRKGVELLTLLKNKTDSLTNMTSVSIDPVTGRIAAIQDNTLFLIDGSEVQVVSNPTAPSAVRFLPGNRIALVDGPTGRIRVLQTGGTHIHSVATAETSTTIDPLHVGGCPMLPASMDRSVHDVAGGTLTVDRAPSPANPNVIATRVAWAPSNGPSTPLDVSCIQVARDGKRALVRSKAMLSLHLAIGSPLDLGEKIVLPVDGTAITSAFLDESDGSVVVTDGSTRVTRWMVDAATRTWVSSSLYDGELHIVYAEPDATGRRLIIVQDAGMGMKSGFVYSVAARQRWFDLGSNYRMFEARYARDGDVALFKDLHLTDLFHTLSPDGYVSLIEAQVPARCRVAAADVTTSPCWPIVGQ